MNMNSIMEISGLHFNYKGNESAAIDIDSLRITEGSLLAVLGSSGAGKTTILRLISGLLAPQKGSIKLYDEEITAMASADRQIGMVFQQPMLFPHLDVLGNVAFPLRLQGLSKAKARESADEYLDLVGMSNFAGRPIHTLSGGQSQRIALARALAAKPRLLLLDEPFAALDIDVRAEMQDLILRLRCELQLTMVLVTHDQREAALLAEQVALVENGKILQQGEISDLYRRPKTLDVFRAMGGANEIDGRVENGYFYSRMGKLPTRDANQIQGPATLTFRQESAFVHSITGRQLTSLTGRIITIRTIGFRYELGIEINGEMLRVETNYRPHLGEEIAVELDIEDCHLIPRDERCHPMLPLNARALTRQADMMIQASAN